MRQYGYGYLFFSFSLGLLQGVGKLDVLGSLGLILGFYSFPFLFSLTNMISMLLSCDRENIMHDDLFAIWGQHLNLVVLEGWFKEVLRESVTSDRTIPCVLQVAASVSSPQSALHASSAVTPAGRARGWPRQQALSSEPSLPPQPGLTGHRHRLRRAAEPAAAAL